MEDKSATPATPADAPAVEDGSTGQASGNVYGDEEDSKSDVKLTGTAVKKGDEDDTLIYVHKARLYRFRDGKWKERGNGFIKLLRSKDNKIKFVQRAEKTLKVTANFHGKRFTLSCGSSFV